MFKTTVIGLSIFALVSGIFATQRPFTVDDLFKGEAIQDAKLSPDGRWLAYERIRARTTSETYQKPWLFGKDRADIWLVSTRGGSPRNLTRGITDASGFWMPVWSPDSRRLAVLSTRGGNVQPWLLDITTGRLQKLIEQGVNIDADPAMLWRSSEDLLCAAMPKGEKHHSYFGHRQSQEIAMGAWPKAMRGEHSTASILDTGFALKRPQGELLLINVERRSVRKLLDGQIVSMRLSPDSGQVAVSLSLGRWPPLFSSGSLRLPRRAEIAVVKLESSSSPRKLGSFEDIQNRYLGWSPDSRSVYVLGKEPAKPGDLQPPDELFIISLQDGSITNLSRGRFLPEAVVWIESDQLLLLAKPGKEGSEQEKARRDWWLLAGTNTPRNITSDLKSAPIKLIRGLDRASFVGLADGELWLLSIGERRPKNMTSAFAPEIGSIVWPGSAQSLQLNRNAIVEARDTTKSKGEDRNLYLFSLAAMEPQLIRSPAQKARLSDWSEGSSAAVLAADESHGSYLWISRPPFAASRKLAELNIYLREIAEPKRVLIDYRGADDKDLKAELIYPHGHKEGIRYPLVVEVYPGVLVGAVGNGTGSPLLGRGYAILKPSMPLRPGDRPSAPLSDMPKNVLPAIDRVVEMGIADSERLGIMGQSYGGYAVLSLITQTKRFKAAIAQSPVSNWISFYGTFVMPLRYSGFQNEIGSMFFDTEEGQIGMKAPPWAAPERYINNSPLFHVERVETPLMIIQGDIDYNSIGQGEEFFTALHRLGKKARFVRYWGEGHGIDSPANVRDVWGQISVWLDEFLKPQR